MQSTRFGAILALGLFAATAVGAVEVTQRSNASALWFDGGQRLKNAVLQITGPDGFASTLDASTGLPTFQLQSAGRLSDGLYKYVLTAATDERVELDSSVDNGRGENAQTFAYKPFSMYGAFRVSRGAIVADIGGEEGSDRDEE